MTSRQSTEVLVPLYNESAIIGRVHGAFVRFAAAHPHWQITFIDDGSTDDTVKILRESLRGNDAQGAMRLIAAARNVGKADAIALGIAQSSAQKVLFIDGDLAYALDHLDTLDRALDRAPIVIGSRAVAGGVKSRRLLRGLSGGSYNLLMRLVLGLPYRDTQAGLKGFRGDAAKALFARRRQRGFGFDAELLFIAKKLKLAVVEVPAAVSADHAALGTNVRIVRDSIGMFLGLIQIRIDALRGLYRTQPITTLDRLRNDQTHLPTP
ncbi:MAG: glycosyltransferase [Phycisphaerales bacterium]|nr:glycosyltransferase [Phycisphaerales bacterium]